MIEQNGRAFSCGEALTPIGCCQVYFAFRFGTDLGPCVSIGAPTRVAVVYRPSTRPIRLGNRMRIKSSLRTRPPCCYAVTEYDHCATPQGGPAEQPERHQHEPGERRQLELDQRDEQLDRDDEEGEQHDRPSEQQHRDLNEVGENADRANQQGRLRTAEIDHEIAEDGRADADDDGEHQHLDARCHDITEHALREEGSS